MTKTNAIVICDGEELPQTDIKLKLKTTRRPRHQWQVTKTLSQPQQQDDVTPSIAMRGDHSSASLVKVESSSPREREDPKHRYIKVMRFNEQVMQCEFEKAERMLKRAERLIKKAKEQAFTAAVQS